MGCFELPAISWLHAKSTNPEDFHYLLRAIEGIWCSVDDLDKKCSKDLGVPEWMCTQPVFPQKHHNGASMAWSHEVLLMTDVIGCIIHTKGL